MKHLIRNEQGIALVVSVVALVIMGALVTAAFTPTYLEQQVAENTRRAGQAFEAAEYGLGEITGAWDTGAWNGMTVGDSTSWSRALPGGQGTASASIRRVNNELFLVDITGTDRGGQARQRIGQFFKLQVLAMDIQAALTTRGVTRIGGSAEVEGNDQHPFGWGSCAGVDTTKAGIRIEDLNDLNLQGPCNDGSCIDGNPAVEEDTTMSDSTFFEYGGMDWDELTSMATKIIAAGSVMQFSPAVTNGVCDVGDPSNFGDPLTPTSPCFTYFPIAYSPGNFKMNGGEGQGILLVEGDLEVTGNVEFYGVVIAKGSLKTTGTGGHFNGAVMAANVDLDDQKVLGNALVQYSSCAVARALNSASPGRPLTSRGWLYTM